MYSTRALKILHTIQCQCDACTTTETRSFKKYRYTLLIHTLTICCCGAIRRLGPAKNCALLITTDLIIEQEKQKQKRYVNKVPQPHFRTVRQNHANSQKIEKSENKKDVWHKGFVFFHTFVQNFQFSYFTIFLTAVLKLGCINNFDMLCSFCLFECYLTAAIFK